MFMKAWEGPWKHSCNNSGPGTQDTRSQITTMLSGTGQSGTRDLGPIRSKKHYNIIRDPGPGTQVHEGWRVPESIVVTIWDPGPGTQGPGKHSCTYIFVQKFFQPKYKPGDIPHYDGTESDDGSSYIEDQSDRANDFEEDYKNSSASKPTTTNGLATQKNKQETSPTKVCKICNVDFGQHNDLKRHLKKVHCDQN